MLEIVAIEHHFIGQRNLIAAIDLRPPGQARQQGVNTLLGSQRNQIVLIEQCGPWADDAHIATQNIPQLGEFIQTAAPQETAHRGQPILRSLQPRKVCALASSMQMSMATQFLD